MDNKIKVLFYNRDVAGVNYYRTLTPAIELDKYHSDKFHVTINKEINFSDPNTIEYLKGFDIINYHRQLYPNAEDMIKNSQILKENGTRLVVDIDDYWELDKTHAYYYKSKEDKITDITLFQLNIADYITTTSEEFKSVIVKSTNKTDENVIVLPNAIDPDTMGQFENNWKKDPNGLVRITYMGGSSHKHDVKQLEHVANMLNANHETNGKFKIILAGWDMGGTHNYMEFNPELQKQLEGRHLWNQEMIKQINKANNMISNVKLMPDDLKETYNGIMFNPKTRPIKPQESTYYDYENILTDDRRIVNNFDYLNWLGMYDTKNKFPNEGNFARRWTKPANEFAKVLDETDIVLAPLLNTPFNRMKSNLKQVECWTRKLPIVCSDVAPYNVDGVNNVNCVLIPSKINQHKDWFKALKKLILDESLRKEIGENLYNDFSVKYHLKTVTEKRAEEYLKMKNNN